MSPPKPPLQAARLRKFRAEAILRTIAAAKRSGEVVPLKGVRDMLSVLIHRLRLKDLNGNDTGVMKWDPYLAPNGGLRRED